MNRVTAEYEAGLKVALTSLEEATAYLTAALEENDQEIFLLLYATLLKQVALRTGSTRNQSSQMDTK